MVFELPPPWERTAVTLLRRGQPRKGNRKGQQQRRTLEEVAQMWARMASSLRLWIEARAGAVSQLSTVLTNHWW